MPAPDVDQSIVASLMDPKIRSEPHPTFNALRERSPVARAADDIWVVSSAAHVEEVLGNPEMFSSDLRNATAVFAEADTEHPDPISKYSHYMMIFTDPPEHDRLRGLVQPSFGPRAVNGLRPFVEELVDEYLDKALEAGSMEVISDLALPVPVAVICRLMGIDDADRPKVHEWADVLSHQLDNLIQTDMEARQKADEVLLTYADFLRAQFADRRENPGDDLLSQLVHAEIDGEGLSEDELIATCVLLLGAGHETTVGMIGNGTLAFLRNPEQWQRLREDPSLAHTATEECFRYDGPVRLTNRAARPGAKIGEYEIPEGDLVITLLAAANRDPDWFEDPDSFDVGRKSKHHNFGSGFGIHWCLGGVLSRMEVEVVFSKFTERVAELGTGIDLGEVEMRDAMMICRPLNVPVELTPA